MMISRRTILVPIFPLWILLPAVLLATGCAAKTVAHVAPASTGVLTGTVRLVEQIALPEDAVVEVWIAEVSSEALALPIVAEVAFLTDGRQAPIDFEVHYDPTRVNPARSYAVRAVIRHNGEILFTSATPAPVLTQGNPSRADVIVSTPPPPATTP